MKHFLVLCLVIAVALAAPADVEVLKNDQSIDLNGYTFNFEQSDGQRRDETGEVRNAGKDDEHIAVRGSFAFTGEICFLAS